MFLTSSQMMPVIPGLDPEGNGESLKGSPWGMISLDCAQRPGGVQREMDALAA